MHFSLIESEYYPVDLSCYYGGLTITAVTFEFLNESTQIFGIIGQFNHSVIILNIFGKVK